MNIAWGQISIATVLATLVGVIIGHRLAIGRDKRTEKDAAGKEFRNCFIDAIKQLDIIHPNHFGGQRFLPARKIIEYHYDRQCSAFLTFEAYLHGRRRKRFHSAWDKYRCYDKKHNQVTLADYATKSPDHHEEVKKRELAKQRIHLLFKYTK